MSHLHGEGVVEHVGQVPLSGVRIQDFGRDPDLDVVVLDEGDLGPML
jgi:predicted methyltransferase MtxX (methanogen marker protein 4)